MRFSQSIPHLVVLPWGICARLLLWEWSRAWRKRMLLVLRWQNLLPRMEYQAVQIKTDKASHSGCNLNLSLFFFLHWSLRCLIIPCYWAFEPGSSIKKSCVFRAWSVVGRCTLAVYHAACSKDFRCSKESFIIEFCSKINTETCW